MTFNIKTLSATLMLLSTPLAAERFDVQSAWPLTLPASGASAANFGATLNAASSGELEAKVYDAGKLVPSLQIFDAVREGTLDAGFTSPLYVVGRFPAVALFGGVPFGPDPMTYVGWIYNGGGLDLWREIYAAQGVVPVPCGLMDAEAGGWYDFEIDSADALKGKNLRFAGLASETMAKLGASVVLLGGGDIYPNLDRGVISGTEFSMPAIDAAMGFERAVKNYYLPGWHQPAALNELIFNADVWEQFADEDRALIETVCKANLIDGIISTQVANADAIAKFKDAGVTIHSFPEEVLEAMRAANSEVIAERVANDPEFGRVWTSLEAYRAATAAWSDR